MVGVPVMAPVDELNVSPGGGEPEKLNIYGGKPPVATAAELYGTCTCPVLAGHASDSAGTIVMLQLSIAVLPDESRT